MNLYSFGDSFTMGLGIDRKFEESNLGEHPKWKTMSEDEKSEQRKIVADFWKDNCFTKLISDKLNVDFFKNHAVSGSSNLDIVNSIVTNSFKFKPNDIVLVGWTSSLRDKIIFWPDNPLKWISSSELQAAHDLETNKQPMAFYSEKFIGQEDKLKKFWKEFPKKWFIHPHYEEFYHIFNTQILYFTQELLNHFDVRYIFFDAFEPMLKRKEHTIDMSKYWKAGNESIWSYTKHDDELLELKDYATSIIRHPSKEGHKYFSKSLYKFYNEVYDG
tara:strand:- start:275 stop:1093 length:819 start_codon:yes stop_codon:yes gene_type:complete